MKTFFKKTICLIGLLLVTACSSTQYGAPINFAKLERLSIGLSTQETVKEVFGYPQLIEYPDNRTIYKYRFFQKQNSSITRQGVDFVFNEAQRLIDITINDANDFGQSPPND
ncbi:MULTISPECIES: hypothetical protein [Vibrio]|uniref:hypothetical protein n=1 Tax=Vibrio TaxID=662 RepID=UPI0004DFBB0D|nr:hypothetical protein [Vibrio parahaemolyticus]EGQ9239485.1 hypothetical protein [Vibrio vulnificus]EHD1698127.1 hypothetical protein [Vibrio vulnificus]EKZ9225856.1 hypothetical protein [Vibrio vulnificus]ELC9582698.1 hypothetical protein [Vibrio vulnificus]MCU8149765.1 hypothetical protein [Vibrio vulnificus]